MSRDTFALLVALAVLSRILELVAYLAETYYLP